VSKIVTVLYFAWLRERTGVTEETLHLPDTVGTVSEVVDFLALRSAGHHAAFQTRQTVRCAVNQEFADPSHVIYSGDEIAFFPPVTGG
jgi:molybdopterin synthase sulfur carrier subunit